MSDGNHPEFGRAVRGIARGRVAMVSGLVTGMWFGPFAGLVELAPRQLIPFGGELLEFVENILVPLVVLIGDATFGEGIVGEIVPDEGVQ